MLARDIYRDLYDEPGPTIGEKLALAGKRLGMAVATCALVLGALDFAGVHPISGDNFAQGTHSHIASLGNDARNGALQRTGKSTDSIRVAIPKTAPKRQPQPSVIDELAAGRSKDAIAVAMTAPTITLQNLGPALAVVPQTTVAALKTASPDAAPMMSVPDIAARSQASVPPAQDLKLASLAGPESASSTPVVTPLIAAAPITIPLNEVPLPRAAPPLSPADRLGLKDKEYARAERCLANAIYFEARSEPVRGQMAVAQVVVNRAFSGFYPNDICGVVYQNASRHLACQFTFACDGKRKLITERGHWAVANRIARQTLDGQIYVPEVGKSTHYHASYVHPNWVHEMKRLVRFGVHSFYRPYAWGNGNEEPVWGTAATVARVQKTAAR